MKLDYCQTIDDQGAMKLEYWWQGAMKLVDDNDKAEIVLWLLSKWNDMINWRLLITSSSSISHCLGVISGFNRLPSKMNDNESIATPFRSA